MRGGRTGGKATRWHRDPFHRATVVFQGAALAIEFRDGRPQKHVTVTPGQVDWDEPGDRPHRAINIVELANEEITIFFLSQPDDVPQPDAPKSHSTVWRHRNRQLRQRAWLRRKAAEARPTASRVARAHC